MTDKMFLTWLTQRLVYVYNENPNVDFVHKLAAIAAHTPSYQNTEWGREGFGDLTQRVLDVEVKHDR